MLEILETCLYAHDLESIESFYRQLGLEFYSKVPGRHVFFRAGPGMLLIFNPEATQDSTDLPSHAGKEGEVNSWQQKLIVLGLKVINHQWPNGKISLYFRDPARNLVELAPRSIWFGE